MYSNIVIPEFSLVSSKAVFIYIAHSGLTNVSGGRVIMACRDMGKCEDACKEIVEETFNKNVHCRKLNLASMKSIREFADDMLKS